MSYWPGRNLVIPNFNTISPLELVPCRDLELSYSDEKALHEGVSAKLSEHFELLRAEYKELAVKVEAMRMDLDVYDCFKRIL